MIFNSTTLIVEKLKISASNNKAVLETMATVVANPIHREKNGRLDLKECKAWGFSTAHGRSSK